MEQLDQHACDGVQRILVGNKVDLVPREVSYEEGEELARKFNMSFFETSAKTGDCVEDAFINVANSVVAHRCAVASAASGTGGTAIGNIKGDKKHEGGKPCC